MDCLKLKEKQNNMGKEEFERINKIQESTDESNTITLEVEIN